MAAENRAYLEPPYRIPQRDRQAILAGLNTDLIWEYAAMIHIRHARMLTGPECAAANGGNWNMLRANTSTASY